MSWLLMQYVMTACIRDRLIVAMLLALVLTVSLSVFMGSAAITEQDYFAVVYSGGSLRIAGILALVLFVVFHIRRSFEAKDIEFLLSRPVGRAQFLLSYATAFSMLAALTGVLQGLALVALGPHLYSEAHLFWAASLVVENIIMVNTALFFAMILSSASSAAMATFALYVLGRMMGQILGIIQAGSALKSHQSLEVVMQTVSVITPRLDLMGQTAWLIQGLADPVQFGFVVVQGLVFTAMVLAAALIDLVRRQF